MSEENNIDINIEQILAAILSNNGKQEVSVESLTADYSKYTVAVNQEENGNISFEIVSVENAE